VVELLSNRAERSSPGSVFATDRGALQVTAVRPLGRRFLVTFAGVDSVEAAEKLRDLVLRAPPLDDPSALWVHELVGSEVINQADGSLLGTVSAVVANPASDLLELDDGGLIPVRCVVDHARGRVVVDIPAGLLE
jgi:16S rRNA processing protein RimM